MDGILVIRKEKGYTSHDVVAKLRGILHMKKIGHTGNSGPGSRGSTSCCTGQGEPGWWSFLQKKKKHTRQS